MIVKCPGCGKETDMAGNPFRPFCSERCKILDLGNWISGTYRIPEENGTDEDSEESIPRKDTDTE